MKDWIYYIEVFGSIVFGAVALVLIAVAVYQSVN